jgi:hypothetical protein
MKKNNCFRRRHHHRQRQRQPPSKNLLFLAAIVAILLAAQSIGGTITTSSSSSSGHKNHHRHDHHHRQQQYVEPCESIIPYRYDSGNIVVDVPSTTILPTTTTSLKSLSSPTTTTNNNNKNSKVLVVVVSHPFAPWIQLDLTQTILAPNAKLLLVGGGTNTTTQELDATTLHDNDHGYSAVFEGDTISVYLIYDDDSATKTTTTTNKNHIHSTNNIVGRLFSAWTINNNYNYNKKPKPKEEVKSSRIIVSNIHVGLCQGGNDGTTTTGGGGDGEIIASTICGNDDRVQSYDVRQGRMGGCTAWLISEDVFLRAGHCGMPNANTRIHFTFSNTAAPPEDQYAVDLLSYRFMNGNGQDWAAGRLLPNSVTGKLPGVAQSEKCGTASSRCGWYTIGSVPTSVSGNKITITGYGSVDATDVRNQETHTGNLLTITSTRLTYDTDTGVSTRY